MDYQQALESTIGIPFSSDNKIKALKNGNEIFPAMLKAIRESKKQVDFLTFVYWKGEVAQDFANALAKKAEEGLQVRVILDCFGAAFIEDELTDMMEESGVQIEWFRPMSQWKIWKSDNRTHRKVLICDGCVGFTGGVGIAKEWDGDARNPSEWRETHFQIEGPAVKGLHAAFLENWVEAGHKVDQGHLWDNQDGTMELAHDDYIEEVPMQVIRTSASVRWSDIVMLYEMLVGMAQKSIRISTAYFNPNQEMVELLTKAAGRGVEIHIMMPGKHMDKRVANVAGEDSFDPLLEAGVHLWFYQKTMFHTKVIVIDGEACCIGSANFNHRSMLKDDEINIVALSEELASVLIEQYKDDLNHCEKVQEGEWKKRSFIQRGLESATNLFKQEI